MEARRVYSWGTLALIALFYALLAYPSLPLLPLITDSDQYTRMSRALVRSEFYRAFDGAEVPLTLSLRPPMYPLMLLVADHLPGIGFEDGIVLVHLFLALAVLVVAPYVLRTVLPPIVTVFATGMALYSNKQMIYCHMSEFLSSLFLLTALFSLMLCLTEPSAKRIASTILSVSLSILTRLALLPWIGVLIVLAFFVPGPKRSCVLAAVIIGLLPLVLWASFNLYRLGTFSFGAHGGYLFVAAARTLGDIPHEPEDSEALTNLIDRLNNEGHGVSEEGWRSERVQQWEGEYYQATHWNFGLAWGPLRPEVGKISALGLFLRAVRAHRDTYLSFLKGSLYAFTHQYALLIVACLLTQIVIIRQIPRYKAVAVANMVSCGCGLLYMGSIFCTFLWVHRYFTSIQPTVVFSMFSGVGLIAAERFRQCSAR